MQQFATRLLENGSESEIMALKKLILTQMLQLFGQIPNVNVDAKLSYTPDVSGFENSCHVSNFFLIILYNNLLTLYFLKIKIFLRNILVKLKLNKE